jgi:hypothetical protein
MRLVLPLSDLQFSLKSLFYFQIEAEVVNNSFRKDFIHGLKDIDTVKYLLTSIGGGGIRLHFLNCPIFLDIKLKFASVFSKLRHVPSMGNGQVWPHFQTKPPQFEKQRIGSSEWL